MLTVGTGRYLEKNPRCKLLGSSKLNRQRVARLHKGLFRTFDVHSCLNTRHPKMAKNVACWQSKSCEVDKSTHSLCLMPKLSSSPFC